jgi:hypothetical protein
MKPRVPSAIYSKEFREQTVKQVTEEGLSPKEAARHLSIPVFTFRFTHNLLLFTADYFLNSLSRKRGRLYFCVATS